jgi:SAM-dependent methyltransferase
MKQDPPAQPPARTDLRSIRDQFSVLNIAEGFFQSHVLFALLKLRIFERMGEGEKSLDELAAAAGAQPATLARLLNAGVVLKLIETQDGIHYRASSASRSVLLPSAGENYLGNWIRNLAYFEGALSKLDEAVLRSGPVEDPAAHLGSDPSHTREFVLAMHNYAALRGKELAGYLDTRGSRTLLDVGCGPGTYAFHLGLANPELELILLDLPGVLEIAREVRQLYPLKNQIHYMALDLQKDEIPGRYDTILVSNTMQHLAPDQNRALIGRLYRCLNPGGSLVVQAQFLRDDRLGERWPVMLDLLVLCVTSAGRNHSVQETRNWLEEAGFSDIQFCPMSVLNTNSFLRATKT